MSFRVLRPVVAAGLLSLACASSTGPWHAAVTAQTPVPPDVGMHRSLDIILDTYVREGLVYYRALRAERGRLDTYISNLDLPATVIEGWSQDEQAAFWLNAYNAIVLRTVVNAYPIRGTKAEYPRDSIQQIPGAFSRKHRVGGRSLSLQEIETDVIASFGDPRMFFALGRGSIGGGRLRSEAFTGARLQSQLASVAAECVTRNECFRYDPGADRILISPVFGWRESAFTKAWPGDSAGPFASRTPLERAVLHLVRPHVLPSEGRALDRNTFTVAYEEYDWRLNDLTDGGPR